MSEENNKIPDTSNDKPKNPHLGEDFQMWLKGRERQKNFLEKKNHLDTQSQLSELRADVLEKKGVEKKSQTVLTKNPDTPFIGNKGKKTSDFSALYSHFYTRKESDAGKGPILAISDSLIVFGGAARDLVVDFAMLIISPRKQIVNTLNSLDDTYKI